MTMNIDKLAEISGMATSKIRFLEARGLLGKVTRRQNSYREYDENTVILLKIIAAAQAAGFSLEEIQPLLPYDLTHWEDGALMPCKPSLPKAKRQLRSSSPKFTPDQTA